MVLARVKWGNVMPNPDGILGTLAKTLAAMFVFGVVFHIGLAIFMWLGMYQAPV